MHICALILACLAQDAGRIEAAGSVVARPEDGRQVFRCEGATNLPDGSRIDIGFFIGDKAVIGDEVRRGAALVEKAKFSCDFDIFSRKVLSGKYIFHVVFDPNLQSPDLKDRRRVEVTVPFRVGTEDDFDKDYQEVVELLCGDMEALVAIGTEVEAKYRESQDGKPAPESWNALSEKWNRRMQEVFARIIGSMEYGVLNLSPLTHEVIEHIGASVRAQIGFAVTGAGPALEAERDYLAEMVKRYSKDLRSSRYPRKTLAGWVTDARRFLAEAPTMAPDKREACRHKIMEVLLILDKHGPQGMHDMMVGLTTDFAGYFRSLPDDPDGMKRCRAAAEGKLDRLDELLRESE